MEKVEAVIRSSQLYKVQEALAELGIGGMTVSEVKGMGAQKGEVTGGGRPGTFKGSSLNPKTKIEIVCEESETEPVIETIRKNAHTGSVGDGKIFIFDVKDSIRIRTGERGNKAV